MQVYILKGSTGEYEDRYEWDVGVFNTLELAERAKRMCEEWCEYMYEEVECEEGKFPRYYERDEHEPHGFYISYDYTGTFFGVSTLDVIEEIVCK